VHHLLPFLQVLKHCPLPFPLVAPRKHCLEHQQQLRLKHWQVPQEVVLKHWQVPHQVVLLPHFLHPRQASHQLGTGSQRWIQQHQEIFGQFWHLYQLRQVHLLLVVLLQQHHQNNLHQIKETVSRDFFTSVLFS
jgi:hypothetical protein